MSAHRKRNVGEAMRTAMRAYQEGRPEQARRNLKKVLAAVPGDADANHLMGVLAMQAGRHTEAERFLSRALRADPANAMAHNNLGESHRAAGALDKAEACYRKATDLAPEAGGFHNNLGVALLALGRIDEAVEACRRAVALDPRSAMAHTNLANALAEAGRTEDAVSSYHDALAIDAGQPAVRASLARALANSGAHAGAVEQYRAALVMTPDDAALRFELGEVLYAAGLLEEAEASIRASLAQDRMNVAAWAKLGHTLSRRDDIEGSIAAYRTALERAPDATMLHTFLGDSLKAAGRLEEAAAAYRAAIAAEPANGQAHWALSTTRTFMPDDPDLAGMRAAHARADLPDFDRMHIGFGLAKALEDVARYDQAFAVLDEANALRRATINYATADTAAHFRAIKRAFSAELFASRDGTGDHDPAPVFILGMPRSGTSLVEQILASHPAVAAAGELDSLPTLAVGACRQAGLGAGPEGLAALPAAQLAELGAAYLAAVRRRTRDDAARLTDKLPGNFERIGLIHLALPNAKIIHCRPDPLDNGLSLYKNYFVRDIPYAYDLGELGAYYRLYRDLMAHWQAVLPGRVCEVGYEDLVADLEGESRRLVSHCGLEWDDRCLSFHQTRRSVFTMSAAQVRRPIYDASVGLWKNYADHLAPLHAALAGDGEAGGESP